MIDFVLLVLVIVVLLWLALCRLWLINVVRKGKLDAFDWVVVSLIIFTIILFIRVLYILIL